MLAVKYGPGGSRANESLKSDIENNSGGIKGEENDHYEELSNARSCDNEDENFDDEKFCRMLSEVSMGINERYPQNKNHAIPSTESKTSRE